MENNKVLGLIGLAARARKIESGTDIVSETILNKKAKLVIVTEDASDRTKNNFEFLCKKHSVNFLIYSDIENLSHSIGKNNKAVICIKDKNFADEIYKKIKEKT